MKFPRMSLMVLLQTVALAAKHLQLTYSKQQTLHLKTLNKTGLSKYRRAGETVSNTFNQMVPNKNNVIILLTAIWKALSYKESSTERTYFNFNYQLDISM